MLSRADIKKLIELDTRRLQKLKEQQALKGINTPPEVLIEIEDVAKVASYTPSRRQRTCAHVYVIVHPLGQTNCLFKQTNTIL